MAFLEVKNVNKAFKKNVALTDFPFELEKGQTICIIGDSGSGKTTFLRIMNYLETMDSGEIYLGVELIDSNKKPSRKEVAKRGSNFGLIFQGFNLFPQYRVSKNIFMPLELKLKKEAKEKAKGEKFFERGKTAKKYYEESLKIEQERLNKYIKEFRLESKLDSYPFELSGGEKQRVAILRALALSPKILCFDEPTSALDPSLKNEVSNMVLKLKSMGITMVVVTHEMTFAIEISDYVVL